MRNIYFYLLLILISEGVAAQISVNAYELALTGEFEMQLDKYEKAIVRIEPINFDRDIRCDRSPCIVNGELIFGAVAFKPLVTKLSAIELVRENGQRIFLDVSAMYNVSFYFSHENRDDAHPNRYGTFLVKSCLDENYCVYRGSYSSFIAEWTVVDGVAMRTIISNRHDIVLAFDISNLDGLKDFTK